MPYKFNRKEYDPKAKAKSDIPPVGAIVAVRVVGKKEVEEFDWAGTAEVTSSKGSPMLRVHVQVCKDYEGEGCWLLDYIILDNQWTGQNIGRLLDGLGFDLSDGVAGYNVTPELLVGKFGYVRIKHEEYKGEPRPRIAYWINPSRYADMDLPELGGQGQDEPTAPVDAGEDEDDGLAF